ncbi:MAB_1171c family putative transporter [Streptomyces sp. NPDC058751]|uniref:MAB_1171c family putative transporter n=1 Tax=Streptomyces sp. NPDC058751 TaxID=3346623 RepID=UPI0036A1DBFB
MSIASYVVAVLWWISAFWRLSSALWGDLRRRALWGVYVAFAAVWTLKTPAVDYGLDHSGINDLSSVVKHVIAIGGIYSLLSYVLAMYGSRDEFSDERYVRVSRAVSKIALKAAVAVVVLLVLLFTFAIDRSKPTEHFVTGHAGELGMTAYMSLVYLYMGGAAAVATYQWGSAVRRTTSTLMRAALGMMCTSMGLAVLYALIRTAYVIYATVVTPTTHIADLQESITEPLQTGLFLMLLLGLTVPATRALGDRIRAFSALIRLHPLWRDLALAVPGPVMLKPTHHRLGALSNTINLLRDVFRLDQPVKDRLARYVTEIRDVTAELQYYAPTDLFGRAKQYAQTHAAPTATAEETAAAAEAYWTSTALTHKTRGDSPRSTQAEFTSASGGDYDSEVPWLQQVAAHYRTAGPATRELVTDRETATA